jgi:adenosylcobinamide-GDP ribazoletransferase
MDDDGLLQAARYMASFPVIGAFLGLIEGICIWLISPVLPPLIVGMIGVGLILLVTGAHHTDGLLDFGDGIMYHGKKREKIHAMTDSQTGAGGFCLGMVVLVTTGLGIASLDRSMIIPSMVAAEAAAKFSMVLEAWAGKSAKKGLNTPFIVEMHGRNARLIISVVMLGFVLAVTVGQISPFIMIGDLFVPAVMLLVSSRHFGGVTGDVLGATNDLTRLVSLLIIVTKSWP